MKKLIKKISAFAITFGILITSFSFGVSAESPSPEPVLTKAQFANLHSTKNNMEFTSSMDKEDRYNFLLQYFASSCVSTDLVTPSKNSEGLTIADEKLNPLGFYIYSYQEPDISLMSSQNDVKINNVTILYDSNDNTWSLVGGGYWLTDNWKKEISGNGNINGRDGVGIAITNLTGSSSHGFAPKESYAYVHDGNNNSITVTNRTFANYEQGVFFEYDDYVSDNYFWSTPKYMGYGFSAAMIYDNDLFLAYNGRATTYYAHTWQSSSITSIGASTTGFSIGFSDYDHSFYAYSNQAKAF